GWPATPKSSLSCLAATANPSTSAAPPTWYLGTCGRRWRSGTATAPFPAAIIRPAPPKRITAPTGPTAAKPHSPTSSTSAPPTTAYYTPKAGTPTSTTTANPNSPHPTGSTPNADPDLETGPY